VFYFLPEKSPSPQKENSPQKEIKTTPQIVARQLGLSLSKEQMGEIEKYRTQEIAPTSLGSDDSPLNTDGSPKKSLAEVLLDMRERNLLKHFFTSLIDHMEWKKQMRKKLARTKYLLSRLKSNRLFTGWKNYTRGQKVLRVKGAIISHSVYRKHMRSMVRQWRQVIVDKRASCLIVNQLT
jgi:hypothetical protein